MILRCIIFQNTYPTPDSIPKNLWISMIFGGIRKIFNQGFFHSFLNKEFDRKYFCMLFVLLLPSPLKELFTSETNLAQKIVLTPLNNKFELKIWSSTSFLLKNLPRFLKKIYKSQFLASIHIWTKLSIFRFKTWLYPYTKMLELL